MTQTNNKIINHLSSFNLTLVMLTFFMLFIFTSYTQNWFGLTSWIRSTGSFYDFINDLTHYQWLPLLIISVPLLGALLELIFRDRVKSSNNVFVITTTFITLLIVMMMYPSARDNTMEISIMGIMGLSLSFHVDMLSYTVLFISSLIWFIVMIYAYDYMKREAHGKRFFFFLALTYSSVLGTIMSGDLLTMFLFFEIMTITSYMLVIHGQKEESYRAGYNYIIMGLIGGFLILAAMILLYHNLGDLSFRSAIEQLNQLGTLRYWIMGLLVLGFGIKAGMAPVHVWLPRAHPVAPTPASALLSGIMIKVGAFGIIRVATSYYFPSKESVASYLDPIWLSSQRIGAAIIWLGIITMAIGVFLALQQSNIKKMLAYHSVSQMGYIVVGIGVALYLGYRGAMGYAGALYHIINHALFKSLLFMVAGVVYYHTKEQDMYKLGGLWKKLPLTATVCLIASLGISGIPLFNGFISKTILHHGIVEAYQYGSQSFLYAEWLFIIVSAGTVCSFIKMFYYVFLRKTENTYKDLIRDLSSLDIALVGMAILIIGIGLAPHFLMHQFIIPQLNMTTYDPVFIDKYIVGLRFFTKDDLLMTAMVVSLGFLIFFTGKKFHLFHLHLPKWLSIEYLFFLPAYLVMKNACRLMYGDKCPINHEDFAKLSDKDSDSIGFIDRFVITTNVFNRRYESSIIKSDALIYTGFVTFILIYMFISIFL
jgi:hydrogenase-4 component B